LRNGKICQAFGGGSFMGGVGVVVGDREGKIAAMPRRRAEDRVGGVGPDGAGETVGGGAAGAAAAGVAPMPGGCHQKWPATPALWGSDMGPSVEVTTNGVGEAGVEGAVGETEEEGECREAATHAATSSTEEWWVQPVGSE
jgi:hypothetical protein